jgi:hypothetical protein
VPLLFPLEPSLFGVGFGMLFGPGQQFRKKALAAIIECNGRAFELLQQTRSNEPDHLAAPASLELPFEIVFGVGSGPASEIVRVVDG